MLSRVSGLSEASRTAEAQTYRRPATTDPTLTTCLDDFEQVALAQNLRNVFVIGMRRFMFMRNLLKC